MTLSVPSVTALPTDANKDRDIGCGAAVGVTGACSPKTAPSSVGSTTGVVWVVGVFGVVVGVGAVADITTAV